MKKIFQSYNNSWTFYIVFIIIFIFLLYIGIGRYRNDGRNRFKTSRRINAYNALKYLTSKGNK
jgi:hypothetical protein